MRRRSKVSEKIVEAPSEEEYRSRYVKGRARCDAVVVWMFAYFGNPAGARQRTTEGSKLAAKTSLRQLFRPDLSV